MQLQIWNQFTTRFVITYSFRAAQKIHTLAAQNQYDISNTEDNIVSDINIAVCKHHKITKDDFYIMTCT